MSTAWKPYFSWNFNGRRQRHRSFSANTSLEASATNCARRSQVGLVLSGCISEVWSKYSRLTSEVSLSRLCILDFATSVCKRLKITQIWVLHGKRLHHSRSAKGVQNLRQVWYQRTTLSQWLTSIVKLRIAPCDFKNIYHDINCDVSSRPFVCSSAIPIHKSTV